MKQAVILVNLGSPASPSVDDVRNYLDEFLHDPNVIDYPSWLRTLIVDGIVLRKRPPKTASLYRSIWTDEGSPLIVHGRNLRDAVATLVDVPVVLAMRYGEPSIDGAVQSLVDEYPDLEHLVLVPLYPQAAMATTKTVFDAFEAARMRYAPYVRASVVEPWFDDAEVIALLASHLAPAVSDTTDAVILSYHGVPERHLRKMDPTKRHCVKTGTCCTTPSTAHATCYRHQCLVMTDRIAELLPIAREQVHMTFQSRFGPDTWITPFTDKTVTQLADTGARHIVIMSPAFVADCLETLEELNAGTREKFLRHGGKEFTYVGCLNADERWAAILASFIRAELVT